jgi:hypothetical protein
MSPKFHPNLPIGSKVIKGFRHFGMAEATRLKKWCQGHLQWHHPPTKFHENQPIGSKVISAGHTDRLVI